MLRQHDCSLLLHRLLDSLVDNIGPASAAIEEAIRGTLEVMQTLPHNPCQCGVWVRVAPHTTHHTIPTHHTCVV